MAQPAEQDFPTQAFKETRTAYPCTGNGDT